MLAILNSLNDFYFPIFQPILMTFASKFMVRRALSDKTYLSLGLLSPLTKQTVKILIRRLIKSRPIWIFKVCKCESEFTPLNYM